MEKEFFTSKNYEMFQLQKNEKRGIQNFWKSAASKEGIPINPKGYLANERTFLHWLTLCLVIGALGIGLINFGTKFAQISGLIFTMISIGFMFYSLVQYHCRQDLLEEKGKEYLDKSKRNGISGYGWCFIDGMHCFYCNRNQFWTSLFVQIIQIILHRYLSTLNTSDILFNL
jgi:hypothetical protein